MEIEEKLEPLVLKAIETIEQTGEFVIAQAPLVLQEFFIWHTTEAIFLIALSVLLLMSHFIIKRVLTENTTARYTISFFEKTVEEYAGFAAWVVVSFLWVIGANLFVYYGLQLLKIMVAPKIYLIEHFTNL